jgi:hypothetical protein
VTPRLAPEIAFERLEASPQAAFATDCSRGTRFGQALDKGRRDRKAANHLAFLEPGMIVILLRSF